ncbi:MAG: GTP-binding protein [Candidatus Lokiarchaeota archaeon]|nr:GTP-binding protein [Candidatus Lokiarchaeota archaeon]
MFKIVVLGEGGVGKTTLLTVIRKNVVDLRTVQMTIGVQFHDIQIDYNGECIQFQVWDFGGQPQFKKMGVFEKFSKGADGALFCFDLSDYETLLTIPEWVDLAPSCKDEDVAKLLIGTKSDLDIDTDQVLIEEYMKKFAFKSYLKTSALEKDNIEKVFRKMYDIITQLR